MSNDRREFRLGARYDRGGRIRMDIEGYRHEGGTPDTGIRMQVGIRF